MNDSDAVIFLLDATKGITKTFNVVIEKLKTIKTPIALVFNKVDLIEKEDLLKLTMEVMKYAPSLFAEVFMISALENDGVEDVIKWVKSQMPEAPWYFEKGMKTDLPLSLHLAEITREKVYEYLHQELPYSIAVKTDKIEEGKNAFTINQTIYTSEENHKAIILGEKGSKIKVIGTKARQEMSAVLGGKKVNLFLYVKVKENWRETPEFFNDIGLDFKG